MNEGDTAKRIDTKARKRKLSKDDLLKIIKPHQQGEGGLITILQKIQEEEGFLARERLELIAAQLNISLAKVMGVVTFYSQFHTQPKGENIIRVCMGTACHVRGAAQVMEKFQEELTIETGESTDDGEFTLEAVSCIGACGLAPVITVNHNTHSKVTKEDIPEILERYSENDQ